MSIAFREHSVQGALTLAAMYAEPVADGGNLVVFSPPYYGSAVFIGTNEHDGMHITSDVQLRLDLARYRVRGPEVAEMLVRLRLAKQFDLSGADIRRLIETFA